MHIPWFVFLEGCESIMFKISWLHSTFASYGLPLTCIEWKSLWENGAVAADLAKKKFVFTLSLNVFTIYPWDRKEILFQVNILKFLY